MKLRVYLLEFLPDILHVLIPGLVGLVAAFKYKQKKELGLALMNAAFFISTLPAIVNLALGGPYLAPRLTEQGYTVVEIGMINLYLFAMSIAFETVSAILFVVGLFRLTR